MIRCVHCGLPEHEHHAFEPEPRKMPRGCKCRPSDWTDDIPITPICGHYIRARFGYCKTCEHDEACHERREG